MRSAHSIRWLFAALVPFGRLLTQTPAVTIDHEAKHHLVFANEWTKVFDVIVPAGDSTLYHVHSHDYAYVTFGDVSLKAQPQGGPQTDLVLANGEVRMTVAPITHRVLNLSTSPFHNLTIELLEPSGATLSPAVGGAIVLDNPRVRAVRIVLEPGASTIRHEHVGPGLDVGVSAGTVSIADDGGTPQRVTYTPASYHWHAGGRTHTLTNVGRTRVEIVEIEWK
jgi:quercetin dioxygenase-like cupin family protein